MSTGCPGRKAWRRWLAGELATAEHAALRGHRAGCPECRSLLLELEPTSLFAELAEPAPPPGLWQQLWPAVSEVVAREPRALRVAQGFRLPGWRQLLTPRWLAPLAACACLVLLSLALPQRLAPPSRPDLEAWHAEADTGFVAQDFVYLGNPGAQVAHLMLQDPVLGPVQLTMVLDEELEADLR